MDLSKVYPNFNPSPQDLFLLVICLTDSVVNVILPFYALHSFGHGAVGFLTYSDLLFGVLFSCVLILPLGC